MSENENKEIAAGSIEVTQEILDANPHLVEKFGCKVGDVITEDRLDPNTEVPTNNDEPVKEEAAADAPVDGEATA